MNEMTDSKATTIPTSRRLPFDRRVLLIGALTVVGAGMTLSWPWWTAIGAAPLILAVASCAVMCSLGLCMSGCGKR